MRHMYRCLCVGAAVAAVSFPCELHGAEPVHAALKERAKDPSVQAGGQAAYAAALLEELGRKEADDRMVMAWTSVALGAAATGAGLLADYEYDASYGEAVWILGLLSVAGGLSNFVFRGPMEQFAAEHGPGSPHYSPAALEAAWREKADEARTGRKIASVIAMGLGVAGIAAATAVVAGAGDLDDGDKAEWSVIGYVGGTAFATAGVMAWFVESPMERHYHLAYRAASTPSAHLGLGVSPVRGGAAVQLGGVF